MGLYYILVPLESDVPARGLFCIDPSFVDATALVPIKGTVELRGKDTGARVREAANEKLWSFAIDLESGTILRMHSIGIPTSGNVQV